MILQSLNSKNNFMKPTTRDTEGNTGVHPNNKKRKKSDEFSSFLSGATLYVSCITLPIAFNYIKQSFVSIKRSLIEWKAKDNLPHSLTSNNFFIRTYGVEEYVLSSEYSELFRNTFWVIVLGVTLAFARMWLLCTLVPVPRIRRCKSSHLLSSVSSNEDTESKFATSIYRLFYCAASSCLALYLFRSAEFWPSYLLGTHVNASTKHCWDLSAGLAFVKVLDNDFDHYNTSLRVYFIFAASYQLQSLCFHFLSVYMMKGSFHFRPLIGHVILLLLLFIFFTFSSLRRLGAISVFSMDISAFFLNTLQAFLHAPPTLQSKKMLRLLYFGFVVPSFLYGRFFIPLRIIWYSVAFESSHWLHQIEHAIPGLASILYGIVSSLLTILLILNIIYLRRLFHIPRVWQLLNDDSI